MQEAETHTSEFYGVYLLCSHSSEKKFRGKCYIGYTVNPNRRVNQHNRGRDFGGARKTSNKGPWKMIVIVHGFPNNISALQFEWAWQQPAQSFRLKHFLDLKKKKNNESFLEYNFRILTRMLNIGPWNRLPLIIRWLETEYEIMFKPENVPPQHMQIIGGKIKIVKEKLTEVAEVLSQRTMWASECHLCMKPIENPQRSRVGCANIRCKLTCHITCMAENMIASDKRHEGHYIPVDGECPLCGEWILWADVLKNRNKLPPEEVEYDFQNLLEFDDDAVKY